MKTTGFDFNAMEDIPPRPRFYDTPRVLVTEKGLFSMNKALRKRVGERREFHVRISADGRFLALCEQGEPNVRFSPQCAHTYHLPLARLLEEKGIGLPAAYVVEWDTEHSAWVGCCSEIAPPPDLERLERMGRGGRRRKGGASV